MPFQENRFGSFHGLFYIFSTTCKTFTHLNPWQMPGVTTTFSCCLFYYKATQNYNS